MTVELAAWLVFGAPLVSFLAIVFGTRPAGRHILSGRLTALAMLVAWLASVFLLTQVLAAPGFELHPISYRWLEVGSLHLDFGFAIDSLTVTMLLVVTTVSFLVQVYSMGYMANENQDKSYSRYYANMSLFTASMLGLVLADNLLQVYFFWELVGLCSYLLVGYWFMRPAAAAAAKKAFIVTRIGDVGFLLALLVLFVNTGTFNIHELFGHEASDALLKTGFLGMTALSWATLGIFMGAAGKSAQFPLHVWLPDAMEGPTPVSALIHAATMVAAGVYLVGRMLPLFHHAPDTMAVVATIGGFTAIFAASMGLVASDIKRVMAYSTISQLGYMMLALGVGAYVAAFFHLMNHAFFKALLFLGAGSVGHYTDTFNMRYMGGLKKVLPITFWMVLIASLSLAGIPPLSGFWSKDEILGAALQASPLLFGMAMVTVFLTAFYVIRMLYLTFAGEYRGGAAAERVALAAAATYPGVGATQAGEGHGHSGHDAHAAGHGNGHGSHEVAILFIPLVVLAVPSVLSGLLNTPMWDGLAKFLTTHTIETTLGEHHLPFDPGLAALSTFVALAGIVLAHQVYGAKAISAERLGAMLGGWPYRILQHKYGMDYLYEFLIVKLAFGEGLVAGLALFDKYVVDGVVNGAGSVSRAAGGALRTLQSGQLQGYGMAIVLGVLIITATMMIRG